LHTVKFDVLAASVGVVGYFKHRISTNDTMVQIRRGIVGIAVERIVRHHAWLAGIHGQCGADGDFRRR
jgi:hypothetical protein